MRLSLTDRIALALPVQIVAVQILAQFPQIVETYYSTGLYPWISKALRLGLGWIPFSFGDVVYISGGLFILRFAIRNAKKLMKLRWSAWSQVFATLSIVYFMFQMAWGLNYYRESLYDRLFVSGPESTENLNLISEADARILLDTDYAIIDSYAGSDTFDTGDQFAYGSTTATRNSIDTVSLSRKRIQQNDLNPSKASRGSKSNRFQEVNQLLQDSIRSSQIRRASTPKSELERTLDVFVRRTDELYRDLPKTEPVTDSSSVRYTSNTRAYFDRGHQGYTNLQEQDNRFHFDPEPVSLKPSLISGLLTYMGFSGYLNPITGEAQTNDWVIAYKTPVIVQHEMAHQQGIARENEANFLAVLTGMAHPDKDVQYAASIFGLRFLLSDFYKNSPERYEAVASTLPKGVFANYAELRQFWLQYEGITEQVFEATYDTYLKANKQSDGIASYGNVTKLLVSYYGQNAQLPLWHSENYNVVLDDSEERKCE